MVFVFSGVLHELVIGVPAHRILGVACAGMILQLPLIMVTEPLAKLDRYGKVAGNCIFWVSFVIVGQPLAAMVYFFAWHAKYGEISKIHV